MTPTTPLRRPMVSPRTLRRSDSRFHFPTPPYPYPVPTDIALLFATRAMRMFAYGAVSVVLVLYLAGLGIEAHRIGLLLTLTLIGDVIVSLYLTTRADRLGRRRTLIAGAILMAGAAAVFAVTHDFWLLLLAATIGVISPSGN